eukprot:tig00000658_g2927.t1
MEAQSPPAPGAAGAAESSSARAPPGPSAALLAEFDTPAPAPSAAQSRRDPPAPSSNATRGGAGPGASSRREPAPRFDGRPRASAKPSAAPSTSPPPPQPPPHPPPPPPPPPLREIRVYLSSPLEDTLAEREAIRAALGPRLAPLCAVRGALFYLVDLRWRASDEPARAGELAALCLREASRCTYLVGVFKRRYGWHALSETGAVFRRNVEAAGREFAWRVEADFPPDGAWRPWLQAERDRHARCAVPPRAPFPPPSGVDLSALDSFAAGEGLEGYRSHFVLRGPRGSGKTALLAAWAESWRWRHPSDLLVFHSAELPRSAHLRTLARRLREEARAAWPGTEALDLDAGDAELAARLRAWLHAAPRAWPQARPGPPLPRAQPYGARLEAEAPHALAWLPQAPGPRLRVVLSCTPGPGGPPAGLLDASLTPRVHDVEPLEAPARRALLEAALAERGAALPGALRERACAAPQAERPLFLRLLVEELAAPGAEPPAARLEACLSCDGPEALAARAFARVAARHGPPAREAAAALLCARHGLAEGELAAFMRVGAALEAAGGPSPLAFCRLWAALRPLLVERGGPEGPPAARVALHGRLGAFFRGAGVPPARRAHECAWHFARAGPGAGEALAAALAAPEALARLDPRELAALWGRPAHPPFYAPPRPAPPRLAPPMASLALSPLTRPSMHRPARPAPPWNEGRLAIGQGGAALAESAPARLEALLADPDPRVLRAAGRLLRLPPLAARLGHRGPPLARLFLDKAAAAAARAGTGARAGAPGGDLDPRPGLEADAELEFELDDP